MSSKVIVDLVHYSDPSTATQELIKLKESCKELIIVDYTHPSAILGNIQTYTNAGVSFVMGTTGGDEQAIRAIFEKGANYAVIAPNMAKQIVALQSGLQEMAKRFPGAFKDYKLQVLFINSFFFFFFN